MKNTIQLASLLLSILLLCSTHSMVAQNTPMPYFCSFENESDKEGWILKTYKPRPGQPFNEWHIGAGAHRIGKNGLYISDNKGKTASYKETGSGYCIVAYKKFTLAPGFYDLAIDCHVGGEISGKDALRVAWISTKEVPSIEASLMGRFPKYCIDNTVSFDNIEELYRVGWKTRTATINATAASKDYYLVFLWKTNGGHSYLNPGACIDNIQIAPIINNRRCHVKPKNIVAQKEPTGLEVSWQGNAKSYELMFFDISSSKNTLYTHIRDIQVKSYTIPYSSLPAGVYSVRVRSVCDSDTSMWLGISDILYFDPADFCFDYLNLKAKGVFATEGSFVLPYTNPGVIDYGPTSKESVHTVHSSPDQYDKYTGYQLKTVPDGSVGSVRLSSWKEGEFQAHSGSISYEYTVAPDVGVFLLNYAAVLQYAAHHPAEEQTSIVVEILDNSSDTLLNPCTYANFNSKQVAGGNYGTWKKYIPPAGLLQDPLPILWSEWRTIGINVKEYVGKTIKIRITLRACSYDTHFAYAYFTVDCNEGRIEGLSCGEKPDTFEVSEGFNYKWYKHGDTTTLGTERRFAIPDGDIDTFCVDLISIENSDCKFTLEAQALPRFPVAQAATTLTTDNCKNTLVFTNESKIVTIWDGEEKIADDLCEWYEWDLGKYGTSFDIVPPPIIVPNHGDTFDISLRAIMEGGCDSIITYTIEVPGFKDRSSYFQQEICKGTVYEQNGKKYTEVGIYTDTIKTPTGTGCDSIIHIKLDILTSDSILSKDTICSDQTIEFFEQQITTSDVYTHTELSVLGCDSVYHEKTVFVYDVLDIDFSADSFVICADEIAYPMPYVLNKGITAYQITYDDKALSAGFVNSEILDINEGDTAKILLPQSSNYVKPDNYEATVTFFNDDCGDLEFPVKFAVHYPSYVLAQRWNDVIALKNADYNGGYEFTSYQWYKDGEAIPDKTTSILYLPETMDFTAEYYLLITRADDAVAMFTCPIVPTRHDDTNIPIGSVTFTEETIKVSASSHGVANLYSSSGLLIKTAILIEGNNSIEMPQECGVYILNITYEDGRSENTKIIVNAK